MNKNSSLITFINLKSIKGLREFSDVYLPKSSNNDDDSYMLTVTLLNLLTVLVLIYVRGKSFDKDKRFHIGICSIPSAEHIILQSS